MPPWGTTISNSVAVPPGGGAGQLSKETIEQAVDAHLAIVELHDDAIHPGGKVLVVDDLLATGGTAKASCELIQLLGGNVVGCAFLLEITGLNGRSLLTDVNVHSVIQY